MYISNVSYGILLILFVWTIPWKAYSLWQAVKRNERVWFLVLLIVNTIGILEIFYIFKIAKKSWAEVKEDLRNFMSSLK